jgi:hypothetical protein
MNQVFKGMFIQDLELNQSKAAQSAGSGAGGLTAPCILSNR